MSENKIATIIILVILTTGFFLGPHFITAKNGLGVSIIASISYLVCLLAEKFLPKIKFLVFVQFISAVVMIFCFFAFLGDGTEFILENKEVFFPLFHQFLNSK